jgi:glycosyltransferase involved in cell wall biosynthesis
MCGKVGNSDEEKKYFKKKIKTYLNDKIEYMGEVSDDMKKNIIKNASGLLFPIQWDEPFGIVMPEAMACGTPVIGFKHGSVPEVVKNGVTGYVVKDFDEFVEKIKEIKNISPSACRKRAEKYFSVKAMVDGYENVYRKVLSLVKK